RRHTRWPRDWSSDVCSSDLMVARVPEQLDPRRAVLARMGQVAFTAVRLGNAELGDTVAVQGLGLVGNLAAQLLKLSGCNVIGLRSEERRVGKECRVRWSR